MQHDFAAHPSAGGWQNVLGSTVIGAVSVSNYISSSVSRLSDSVANSNEWKTSMKLLLCLPSFTSHVTVICVHDPGIWTPDSAKLLVVHRGGSP